MKGNKVIVMVLLLLVATVLVSGCAQQGEQKPQKTSTITSKEQAAEAVPDALEKTDKALGALEDIKQDLGG